MLLLFELGELFICYSICEHRVPNVTWWSLSQMIHKMVSASGYLVATVAVLLWYAVNSVKMLSVKGLDVSNILILHEWSEGVALES
jgi:hypothetical protein